MLSSCPTLMVSRLVSMMLRHSTSTLPIYIAVTTMRRDIL